LESEVFLLGHWKNFDELEENLSIEELNAILEAGRIREERNMKFQAALQGVDLDKEDQEKEETSNDVAALKNARTAESEGFGFGEGLGFLEQIE
jgi:hypothetical protein